VCLLLLLLLHWSDHDNDNISDHTIENVSPHTYTKTSVLALPRSCCCPIATTTTFIFLALLYLIYDVRHDGRSSNQVLLPFSCLFIHLPLFFSSIENTDIRSSVLWGGNRPIIGGNRPIIHLFLSLVVITYSLLPCCCCCCCATTTTTTSFRLSNILIYGVQYYEEGTDRLFTYSLLLSLLLLCTTTTTGHF